MKGDCLLREEKVHCKSFNLYFPWFTHQIPKITTFVQKGKEQNLVSIIREKTRLGSFFKCCYQVEYTAYNKIIILVTKGI